MGDAPLFPNLHMQSTPLSVPQLDVATIGPVSYVYRVEELAFESPVTVAKLEAGRRVVAVLGFSLGTAPVVRVLTEEAVPEPVTSAGDSVPEGGTIPAPGLSALPS